MEMMGKIRRVYFRDKLSLHQIAKRTGLSRKTIRKWGRAPEATQPAYLRCATFNKLSPFHETLEQALKADSFRAKHNRRSAKALFEQIKAEGYDGGYRQFTAFIRSWRGEQGKSFRAFVLLTFALGEAFQFDWSEEGLLIGGLFRRIQVSHMMLCASRAFWLVAYPSQGHEMLFDAHSGGISSLRKKIKENLYSLGDFQLVESSETAMRMQVSRAIRREKAILFLGWAPHPMNLDFKMTYLSGGDQVFGPNYGAATVYTVTTPDYAQRCPNAAKLISNMKFDVQMESELMMGILDKKDPLQLAKAWITRNPQWLDPWLDGLTTFDGKDAKAAAQQYFGL